MKIKYSYALVSFCPDLTDPDAESVPIAVVGVGSVRESNFWFYVIRGQPGDTLNLGPPARDILNRFPEILREQVAKGMTRVPPSQFLGWLHDLYRNSLHVAEIADRTAEVPEGKDFAWAQIAGEVTQLYHDKVLQAQRSGRESELSDNDLVPDTKIQRYAYSNSAAMA